MSDYINGKQKMQTFSKCFPNAFQIFPKLQNVPWLLYSNSTHSPFCSLCHIRQSETAFRSVAKVAKATVANGIKMVRSCHSFGTAMLRLAWRGDIAVMHIIFTDAFRKLLKMVSLFCLFSDLTLKFPHIRHLK